MDKVSKDRDGDWDFDQIIDRKNTGSVKWSPDILRARFGKGREHLTPFWVADMDFYCPPAVHRAMAERLDHRIYGYSLPDSRYLPALTDWFRRRHRWEISPGSVLSTPGIVPAVNYVIQRFSKPGDKVIIQSPVYYPFATAIETNGRAVADNPLKVVGGRYEMDLDHLALVAADPRVKIAILCSPHNPVGRVWTREELEAFGRICLDNGVLVLSDEIHCDLVMPGHCHIPFQTLSEAFAFGSIAATAASKTFNLAGLSQSALIIPDPAKRQELGIFFETLGLNPKGTGTLFGAIASRAAYEEGEAWLDDLIPYLWENYTFLKGEIENRLPGVRVAALEGTYLPWIDFTGLGLSADEIVAISEMKAGLALDPGDWFGQGGGGFMRINIACPRALLKEAAASLVAAFKPHTGSAAPDHEPAVFPRADRGGQCCN